MRTASTSLVKPRVVRHPFRKKSSLPSQAKYFFQDSSQKEQSDGLSHSSGLPPSATSSAGGPLSGGISDATVSRSFRRRARRKAAAEAGKFCAPTSGFSALAPTGAVAKQEIMTSGSFDLQEDIPLLPGFSPAPVCQMDSENGMII